MFLHMDEAVSTWSLRLEELVNEHRSSGPDPAADLRGTIFELAKRNGMLNDVPFLTDPPIRRSVV
jgi:hypothetical protein